MRLDGRIAIVTGASSGIGRGIAIELARDGANIAIADVSENPKKGRYYDMDIATTTTEEVEKLGSEAVFYQVDISSEEEVKAFFHQVEQADQVRDAGTGRGK